MSLFTSGSKGAKFTTIGDSITGKVLRAPEERQQTKFGSQDPDFWPNGDPKMQIVVPLATDQRDPADVNDDGERTLYVASKNMKRAIGDAIRVAGVQDVAVGGLLSVQYVGNDPASKNPQQPAKMYAAQYTPPTSAFQQATPPPAVQTVAAAQAQAPFATPQPAVPAHGLTDDQVGKITQLRAAGIPDDTIATAVGATAAQLAQFDATPF
jgi:hypothetical protein